MSFLLGLHFSLAWRLFNWWFFILLICWFRLYWHSKFYMVLVYWDRVISCRGIIFLTKFWFWSFIVKVSWRRVWVDRFQIHRGWLSIKDYRASIVWGWNVRLVVGRDGLCLGCWVIGSSCRILFGWGNRVGVWNLCRFSRSCCWGGEIRGFWVGFVRCGWGGRVRIRIFGVCRILGRVGIFVRRRGIYWRWLVFWHSGRNRGREPFYRFWGRSFFTLCWGRSTLPFTYCLVRWIFLFRCLQLRRWFFDLTYGFSRRYLYSFRIHWRSFIWLRTGQSFYRSCFSNWGCWLLSLIHIWRCRRYAVCRSRWSPYH